MRKDLLSDLKKVPGFRFICIISRGCLNISTVRVLLKPWWMGTTGTIARTGCPGAKQHHAFRLKLSLLRYVNSLRDTAMMFSLLVSNQEKRNIFVL